MTLHQQATGNPAKDTGDNPVKKGMGMSPLTNKASASPTGRMQNIPQSGQTRELKIASTNRIRKATVFDGAGSTNENTPITDDVYIWAVHMAHDPEEETGPKAIHIVSRDTVRRTIATFYQTPGEHKQGYSQDTYYKLSGAIYCPGGFDADTSAAASGKVGTLTIFYSLAHQGSMIGGQANR